MLKKLDIIEIEIKVGINAKIVWKHKEETKSLLLLLSIFLNIEFNMILFMFFFNPILKKIHNFSLWI